MVRSWNRRRKPSPATTGSRCCWSRRNPHARRARRSGRRWRPSTRSSGPPRAITSGRRRTARPSTATTVRVRDGEVIVTDGPYVEGAEVATGFYLLSAADRDEAVKIASMIPASTVRGAATGRCLEDCNVAPMTNLDGVFRREWGPAVAALARWSGDLTVAEDAVQEACAEALRTWPRDGLPDNPGGWLVTVARNRARDRLRRESVRPGKELAAAVDDIRARTDHTDPHPVRDDELRMMFTCAHPGAGPAVATGAHAAVGVRVDRRRDRPRAAADRDGDRPANHPRQEQDSARQHPAAGAAGRAAARAHTTRAQLHLLGVHRGILVDRGPVGDSGRTVRRRGPAGRRAVRADAARAGSARPGRP